MKLQEYHAKSLLERAGLPVPPWSTASTPQEARSQAETFLTGGAAAVVIKAQVLVGGRGKAGGVKVAHTSQDAERMATDILGMDIKGIRVRRVLVAPAADIVREMYLATVLDRASKRVLFIASGRGGVDIEALAESDPDAIVRLRAHPHLGLLDHQARRLAFSLGLRDHLKEAAVICHGLFTTLIACDADLVEINPLAVVLEGGAGGPVERLALLDAKITIDDSALSRHPDIEAMRDLDEEDPLDIEARKLGLSFIRLDGDIGCMVNGAGLAMTTMDLVKRAGGSAANFLDIGGGARSDKVAAAIGLILREPSVKVILVNIFGGIARGDEVARGLVEARGLGERSVPMVVRIVGTNAQDAVGILAAAGAGIETAQTLDQAVERAVALARGAVAA